MSTTALIAQGLGKEYRLGRGGARRTLYETLARWKPGRGEDPRRIWALRGASFSVDRGEVVGVVGRNGAGKSTLLKLLSRITRPTEGRAVIHGNLSSLLEVGTGFHPELSGRENVFLNGTILGMTRREIQRKFDEIVEFAEIERFLDTPVKRYSSGMYVRLAFAVAAHLDADVLLVDEVLAVGDLAFQRKCLGKMDKVAASGRTILFVSHNLGAVRALCGRVLLLADGRVEFDGPVEEGLVVYEAGAAEPGAPLPRQSFSGPLTGSLTFDAFEMFQDDTKVSVVDPTQLLTIEVSGESATAHRALDIALFVTHAGHRLFSCHDAPPDTPLPAGRFRSRFEIAAGTLRPGRYTLGFGAHRPGVGEWTWASEIGVLEVVERWGEAAVARDVGALSVPYSGKRFVGDAQS